MTLTAQDGTLVAEAGAGLPTPVVNGQVEMVIPMPANVHHLSVSGGSGAANDSWIALFTEPQGVQREADEVANDVAASAEPVQLVTVDGAQQSELLLELVSSDVDHFQIVVPASAQLTVDCDATTVGSGVTGLSVQIVSDTFAVLASATEDVNGGREATLCTSGFAGCAAGAGTVAASCDDAGLGLRPERHEPGALGAVHGADAAPLTIGRNRVRVVAPRAARRALSGPRPPARTPRGGTRS